MRQQSWSQLAAFGLAVSLAPNCLQAQHTVALLRLSLHAETRVWIEGTSNVRAWRCGATALDAQVSVDSAWGQSSAAASTDVVRLVRRVEVKVPVRSLQCGNRTMNRILYKALKAEGSSTGDISGSFEVLSGATRRDGFLRTAGTLHVAGAEQTLEIDVRVEPLAGGMIRVATQMPILMSDFGVQPPTALFGAVRAGNLVVVKLELLVAPNGMVPSIGSGAWLSCRSGVAPNLEQLDLSAPRNQASGAYSACMAETGSTRAARRAGR